MKCTHISLNFAFPPLCLPHFFLPQNIGLSHLASISPEFLILLGGTALECSLGTFGKRLWGQSSPHNTCKVLPGFLCSPVQA